MSVLRSGKKGGDVPDLLKADNWEEEISASNVMWLFYDTRRATLEISARFNPKSSSSRFESFDSSLYVRR